MNGTKNPLGMTDRQCQMLDAVIEHGLYKAAAPSIGLSERAMQQLVTRMKRNRGYTTTLQMIVAYAKAKACA